MPARRIRQYQSTAAPVFVPSAAAVALDWLPSYPLVLPRARRLIDPPSVAFVELVDVAPAVALDWSPTFVDRITRPRSTPQGANALVLDTSSIAFDWAPSFPNVLRRLAQAPIGDPFGFSPFYVPSVAPEGLSWAPSYPNRIPSSTIDRSLIPWTGDLSPDPIPEPVPPAGTNVLNYRQQKSWYRSSS
jgi:hypothetical protein